MQLGVSAARGVLTARRHYAEVDSSSARLTLDLLSEFSVLVQDSAALVALQAADALC